MSQSLMISGNVVIPPDDIVEMLPRIRRGVWQIEATMKEELFQAHTQGRSARVSLGNEKAMADLRRWYPEDRIQALTEGGPTND